MTADDRTRYQPRQRGARPNELVEYASRAEEAGFDFTVISDHYHPWVPFALRDFQRDPAPLDEEGAVLCEEMPRSPEELLEQAVAFHTYE